MPMMQGMSNYVLPVTPATLTGLKLRADQIVLDLDRIQERIQADWDAGRDRAAIIGWVQQSLQGTAIVAESLADQIDRLPTT